MSEQTTCLSESPVSLKERRCLFPSRLEKLEKTGNWSVKEQQAMPDFLESMLREQTLREIAAMES
jgi:hypothetical protein